MSRSRNRANGSRQRRGIALVLVSVVVVLVALAAYQFNQRMTDAYRLATYEVERVQSHLTAESGVEFLLSRLEHPRLERSGFQTHFEGPIPIVDDFGVSGVGTDGLSLSDNRWRFAIVSPNLDDLGSQRSISTMEPGFGRWRWGTVNESSKIHLETLKRWDSRFPGHAREALLRLPGADALVVEGLLQAYQLESLVPSSTRLERIREGVSSRALPSESLKSLWALFWTGGDWNHDYQVDELEAAYNSDLLARLEVAGENWASQYSSRRDRIGNIAWRDYLTVCSGQRNENRYGRPRILLNQGDLPSLRRELEAIWPASWTHFVIAARQFGIRPRQSRATQEFSFIDPNSWAPNLSRKAAHTIASPLDLFDAVVLVPDETGKNRTLVSPFSTSESDSGKGLASLLDDVTVNPNSVVIGQIDILTAPAEVLLSVPNMSPSSVRKLIRVRQQRRNVGNRVDSLAWVVQKEILGISELKQVLDWITVGGDCQSCQVVGYRDVQSPLFRGTVLVDATTIPATLKGIQRWHQWGRGFSVAEFNEASR